MLDFYFINDNQPKPEYPEKGDLKYGIGLNYNTYEKLIQKGIIDSRFNYHSDFRWDSKLVIQIINRADERKIDSDAFDLIKILKKASELNCGLIAYGD